MLYTRSEYYVRKEEYFRILSSSNLMDALKNISKEFIFKIIKSTGEKYVSLTTVLEALDSFHVGLMKEISESRYVREFASSINGLLFTYGTLIALLSYERGLKPVSYLPNINNATIEEYITGKKPSVTLNPYSELLLNLFTSRKSIKAEDVLGIYDHIRRDIVDKANYREKLVAGLMYDLTILRLCTIGKLDEAAWRPLLLDQKEFLNICRMINVDIISALDALKKTRPLLSTVSSLALDAYKIINGSELLDFLIALAPAYFSTLILRSERTSLFLKDYLVTLRQLSLLRLVITLVHLGDESLKNNAKNFIERWVSP